MINYKVWPQVLIAIAANGGSILYGMTLGWSAPTGPRILSAENGFEVTEAEFSWVVAMMPMGGALSCVISGVIRNRCGTKLTILTFAIPSFLGWLSIAFASDPLMLMIGRLLIGLAGGAYCYNIPVFVGELASKEIRGLLLTLYQVSVKIGVVSIYMLGSTFDLFTLNIICASWLIIYTTVFLFLPETPVFLVRNNEIDKAEKSIKQLRGKYYDAKLEISELQTLSEEASKAPKSSFSVEFKKRETFKAFVIIIFIFFFFQMSGINAVIVYTTSIFIDAGVTMDPSVATIILGIVQVFATLATAAFVDRFGRVFLLITSFTMMIFGHFGIGTYFYLKDTQSELLADYDWLPLPSLSIFVIGFSLGMGPVPFILLGEIFSNDAKKVIAPIAQTMSFVMAFIIGLIYPALITTIGTGFTFFMFAGFCFMGLLFTIFVIPETKGKSLAEIQVLLGK